MRSWPTPVLLVCCLLPLAGCLGSDSYFPAESSLPTGWSYSRDPHEWQVDNDFSDGFGVYPERAQRATVAANGREATITVYWLPDQAQADRARSLIAQYGCDDNDMFRVLLDELVFIMIGIGFTESDSHADDVAQIARTIRSTHDADMLC